MQVPKKQTKKGQNGSFKGLAACHTIQKFRGTGMLEMRKWKNCRDFSIVITPFNYSSLCCTIAYFFCNASWRRCSFDDKRIGFFLSVWWFVSAQPHVPTLLCCIHTSHWTSQAGAQGLGVSHSREGRTQIMGSVCAPRAGWWEKELCWLTDGKSAQKKTKGSIRKQIQSCPGGMMLS